MKTIILLLAIISYSKGLEDIESSHELSEVIESNDFVLILWGSKTCLFCVKVEAAIETIEDQLEKYDVKVVKVIKLIKNLLF